jgi:hypothetical protein
MNRIYFFLLFLLVPSLAGADKDKTAWQGPDQSVYVVTQNHYAEGFGPEGDTAGFSDLLAIEIYNPKARPEDQDATYEVGEHLALFLGGQRQGEIKIEKVLPLQCDSSAAVVSAGSPVHFTEGTRAIATNAKSIVPHARTRRQTAEEEKKYVKELAMKEFQKHGVPGEAAKLITIEQSIVTKIDQSESQLLIAYAYVKFKGVCHEVFLLGRLDGSSAVTELARYHKTTDVQEGTDGQGYRFVDQLDMDGDGTDEIVVEVTGYESEEFRILKRVNGSWVRVHVGGQGGC